MQYRQAIDIKQKSNNKKIDSNSENITKEIKNAVFKKIFEVLDTYSENKIYGKQIDLSLIPESLRKILDPLFFELNEQNESLTMEEFLLACEHLYSVRKMYLK